jgi:hypothetical protein
MSFKANVSLHNFLQSIKRATCTNLLAGSDISGYGPEIMYGKKLKKYMQL